MDHIVRPVEPGDLPQIYDIYYEDLTMAMAAPPPRPPVIGEIRHEVAAGVAWVAERAGRVDGFATLSVRGRVAFLSSLFVRQDTQSAGLGWRLLQAILPLRTHLCCTISSGDPRALALYSRSGMAPRWPELLLQTQTAPSAAPTPPGLVIDEADAGDPALEDWDARIGGRRRPQDLAYLIGEERAVPLWFRRGGEIVGYGLVRLSAGTPWHPDAATLGPIGAVSPDDARDCTIATVAWAWRRAPVLRIDLPGPHPALAALLGAGFRIIDMDTFMSAAAEPFAAPDRYIGSGGSLF